MHERTFSTFHAMQVTLHRVYHNQPAVTCQILKLAGDIVEAHVSYIQVSVKDEDFL
jgi:hypothetical protein